jgi:RNA polymerase-associated protein
MELWHAWTCPYCQRVRIALAEKRLQVEEHVVDLGNKPPELMEVNPAGGVPVLVVDGVAIPDSSAILRHLEDHAPEPALFPPDPLVRARALLIQDRVTSSLGPHIPKLLRGSGDEKEHASQAVRAALQALEQETPEEGFLCGPFSIADIALAPLIGKLPASIRSAALGLPRLARWEASAMSRASVVAGIGMPGGQGARSPAERPAPP